MKEVKRRCVACYQMLDRKCLIKIAKVKDLGYVIEGKSGRGAYVCSNEGCISTAIKKRAFDRAFKCSVDQEIYDALKERICKESSD